MHVRSMAMIPVLLFSFFSGCKSEQEPVCKCPPAPDEARTEAQQELYTLPGLEHGLVQSPVNILSEDAVHGKHRVALHYDHTAPNFIVNKGTTIELDFPEGGGSITYDGKEYDLLQLHDT